MSSLEVSAPAKINLGLRITGARNDGFHSIQSVFALIDLADTLSISIEETQTDGISLSCSGIPSPADSTNIVWKAAELFRRETGLSRGISIHLHKEIPSPGGLGGGSSDCAATLTALAELTGLEIDLHRAGEHLGSDVPFFISGFPSAFVTGRGETVNPCRVPEFHCVLVNSGEHIPAKTAYSLWDSAVPDLTGAGCVNHYTALNFGVWHEGKPFPVELGNDFLPVLARRYEGVRKTAEALSDLGFNWGLSGSGPVFYALFHTAREAAEAKRMLEGRYPGVTGCRSRQIGASSNG